MSDQDGEGRNWERCPHRKDDGERCRVSFGLHSQTGLCWFHDPERAESRDAARQKAGRVTGGRNSRRRVVTGDDHPGPLETAADARRWADWVTRSVAEGVISPDVSAEIRGGLREFLKCFEASDLEDRIGELQRQIEAMRKLRPVS